MGVQLHVGIKQPLYLSLWLLSMIKTLSSVAVSYNYMCVSGRLSIAVRL